MVRNVLTWLNEKGLIGTKDFYRKVLSLALPIMAQNIVTNFVNLVNNLMVGKLGTEELSGVAISNQLIFVYSMSISGILAGAGLFTAQFVGRNDEEGVRNTFRYKLFFSGLITLLLIILFYCFGNSLIGTFLNKNSATSAIGLTDIIAKKYLNIMLIGLIPFAVTQVYASTLRETGYVIMPVIASFVAVILNTILNYVLIYGKFGIPELGTSGAAISTVISRIVECSILIFGVWKGKDVHVFIKKSYLFWKLPEDLLKRILLKGIPTFISILSWSVGVTILVQAYSVRGLDAIAAYNIASTVNGIFTNVFGALGVTLLIVVGQLLGAGQMEYARDVNKKIIAFAIVVCIVIAVIMSLVAPLISKGYNTSEDVKRQANYVMWIMASILPCCGFTNCASSTLRAGGLTTLGFILDGMYALCISAPMAVILSRYTNISFVSLFFICQYLEVIKAAIQFYFVKKGDWLQNVVNSGAI